MKISKNWLCDYIDLPKDLDLARFCEVVTLSVCEVEGVEETGAHLSQVLAALVTAIKPHPSADKLRLVTIETGKGTLELVCGAHNFEVGAMVVFAGLGTVLPGGFEIKPAQIRGVESMGMLCAEDELGFSSDHEGLMLLPIGTKPGTRLSELYPDQQDWVLEIDNKSVTHRPDLWGHYGYARELGAIFKLPVKPYPGADWAKGLKGDCPIKVNLAVPELVHRYSGVFLEGVQVVPSSEKIKHRLHRVGLRPINNLVDVTNYVMLDLGQPMHAFDGSQIAGNQLTIRRGKAGEQLTTLYQKTVTFSENDLTIADDKGPSVIAGVVGGLNSGVKEGANCCFLEAACWEAVTIRQSAARLGHRTDAAQRFEKALAPEHTELALARAVDLLKETCPQLAIKGGFSDHWGLKVAPVTILTSYAFITKRLGQTLTNQEIDDSLARLGFALQIKGNQIEVEVPAWRRTKDVSIPEDLVEEVGRIYGLNQIAPKPPLFPIVRPQFNQQRHFENRAKRVLAGLGFHEIYSYPLTDEKTEAPFGLFQDPRLVLLNPVAETQDRMRTSLLPHMVERVRQNQKIAQGFKLFELGISYHYQNDEPQETPWLLLCRSAPAGHLGEGFYRLKADLVSLLNHWQVPSVYFEPAMEPAPYQHPKLSAELYSGALHLGRLFSLRPSSAKELGLKGEVYFTELSIKAALEAASGQDYKYAEPWKFPAVFLDLSLVVPKELYFAELQKEVEQFDPLVRSVRFFDVFESEALGDNKSLSITVEFRAPNRTLSADETKDLQDRLINRLALAGFSLR